MNLSLLDDGKVVTQSLLDYRLILRFMNQTGFARKVAAVQKVRLLYEKSDRGALSCH